METHNRVMESIADHIAVDYQKGPLQKNQKTDNGMVLPFSISYEHLKRNPRLVDMLVTSSPRKLR
jgi:hypothetical protein